MKNIIEIDRVSVRFGHDWALNEVSNCFEAGKIHGLIGRNGSGKTVLLKCICGFVIPTQGVVRVREQEVGNDVQITPDIGGIIESPGFLPNYSAYKNLSFLAGIRGTVGKNQVIDSIKRVGLDAGSRKWVSKYSLGMRQRLGIAQAIMENPSILILDEPMNGLDNRGVQDMRRLFMALRDEGKTILLASHNPQDIEELCDTVCEMDAGIMTVIR